MKKFLSILLFLAFTVPVWAGEQTITISRKDGQFNSAEGVYYASKGGVTMTMSGGMNNSNFLVLRHMNTVTFKSANFAIKKIIFHCLDDFTSSNLDVFYWGPTTMNVMTVNYKPAGSNTTTAVTPGKFTASGYDGTWTSDFTGTWTSTFRTTDGSTDETRTHTKFPNGWPAGNSLIFGSRGKPVRFSSIDIIIEKEDGDIYDLVTNVNQIVDQHNYLIVNWESAKALSVNTKQGRNSKDVRTGSPVTFISGHVDNSGQYDQYAKVRTDGEAQIIKFEKHTLPISTSSGTINDSRAWTLKAGGEYFRIYSSIPTTNVDGNNGPDLYTESSIDDEWSYAAIALGYQEYGYNARIRFRKMSSIDYPRPTDTQYRICYNPNNNYFRDLYYGNGNSVIEEQNIRLYTPAQNYNVTTEVQPDASKGSIALRDGVIVNDASATSGTSQQYETVSFLVNSANGFKISNVTIQAGTSTIDPESVTITTNGTLYTFVMPASDVHIIAEFAEVEYHNVNIVIDPDQRCGNVFITDGYVVQNDQVKSFEGQNVVFNVISNLINIDDETEGYYELKSVTVTDDITGQSITYNLSDGNYNFTMPNHDVTITATFKQDAPEALYLLGTANGGYWTFNNGNDWRTYGPVFNYNKNIGYYLDVYFKGTGEYDPNGNTDNAYGFFSLSKRYADNQDWGWLNGYRLVAHQYDSGNEDIADGNTKTLYADADNNRGSSFRIPAGIYRIVVNKNMTQVTVTKKDLSLNFDPTGGNTIDQPVTVSPGTNVSLMGSLYNVIQSVNSNIITPPNTPLYNANHDDANFKYKAVKTIGENSTTEGPTASTTILNTTLDVVNEGETVTQLDGWNYLGWIVASNTGYYKVTETPLHWIEEFGEKDKTYTVSDRLQGVYAKDGKLWCKDLGDDENPDGISIVKTTPAEGQIDYLAKTLKTEGHIFHDNMRIGDWDQSNWVELDFTSLGSSAAIDLANNLVNHFIKAGTVTGVYSDDVNYTITLTAIPEEDGETSYVPNTYSPSNFIESNLNIDGHVGPTLDSNGFTYYFLNPKVQEYAIITYAMWDMDKQIMVIPNNTPFNGAAKIGRWDLNEYNNQQPNLDAAYNDNNTYEFHIIVQRANKSYGTPAPSVQGAPRLMDNNNIPPKPDQTTTGVIMAQPLDLQTSSILTAINRVGTEAQVVGVEYVNIAGMRSRTPWQGINIMVTRYSDGTTTTTKVVK